MVTLLSFVLFGLTVVRAFSYTETFYVSENGDGTAPKSGNTATAWTADDVSNAANWSTAVATVDNKIGPDDRIYFLSGGGTITATGTYVVHIQGSGVAGYPITLQGDGSAVLDGQNTRRVIRGNQKDYIVIDNLKVTRGYQFSISFMECNNWTIENSEVWATYQTATTNGTNIGGQGNNFLIQYNSIHNALGQHGIYLFSGNNNDPSNNNVIQYNNIHDNPVDGIHLNGNGGVFTGNVIRYNWFANNTYASIGEQAGNGTEIYGNVFVDNDTPYRIGIVVGGDGVGANPLNTKIYNNTFWGNFYTVVWIGVNSSTGNVAELYNNILFETSGDTHHYFIYLGTNGTLTASDYNQFYDSVSSDTNRFYVTGGSNVTPDSLAAWQTETGMDSHSGNTNPDFVTPGTDFHLKAGSPCIDSGKNVGLLTDRDGTVIPTGVAPDKGAYEYHGGTNQPQTPGGLEQLN